MNKMKVLLFVTILAFIAILSACSQNDKEGAEGTNTTTAPAATQSPSSASTSATESAKPDVSGKYDPPIEITTVRASNPYVKFAAGEDLNNNDWTREYLDKWGIKVTNEWIVDSSQLDQKTNLMITTGDLPDYFQASPIQFKQLLDAGLIEDLTEAYKTAPPNVSKVLTEDGDRALKSATVDGKLMAIPFTQNLKENGDILWIRTDWLEKLGLSEPKTMQDVLAVSKAFTKDDPDGNNKEDTIGFAATNTLRQIRGIMNGFHAYLDIWMKDASGNLVYSSIQPEMKTALAEFQRMYQDGELDKELPTINTADKMYEKIANGKAGMYGQFGSYPLQLNLNNDPTAKWKAILIPSIDSEPTKMQYETAIPSYWVVRKGYEHPEAVFKLLDTWLENFYFNTKDDIQLKYVATKEQPQLWINNEIAIYRAYRNLDINRDMVAYHNGEKTEDQLTPQGRTVLDLINKYHAGDKTGSVFGSWAGFSWDGVGQYLLAHQYIENNAYVENEFSTTPTPTMTERWGTLLKLEQETFMKIITGNLPISEFDKFVDTWKKTGGDTITGEVNDWYKSTQ